MNHSTQTNKVWYSKRFWTYQQFYLNHFFLTKRLNKAMMRNFELMLGQTLNDCV
jgi:hypothetical protein